MEKLKVGDKVYSIRSHFGYTTYRFSEVERLTKTQAILESGDRLKNEPNKSRNNDEIEFKEIGADYSYWGLTTDEVMATYIKQQEEIKIKRWFNSHKFTQEEKETIYNILNN